MKTDKTREFADGEGVLLADIEAEADAPVWIQVAKQGAFAGHPAGPFKLDLKAFEEIIANFKATTNQHIPWDFEHASEMDATSGSIPQAGCPAQGWITDLKIEGGNLYGLTQWGDLARQYVREGKYRYCSPAIRFGSKDRVTGKPIGCRLTSVALTNEPFLDALAPLAASDKAPAPNPRDHMPAVKAALSAHEALCTGTECAALHGAVSELMTSLDDDGGAVDMTDHDQHRVLLAEGAASRATLLLREASARIESQTAELRTLRDAEATRAEADLREEVEMALETYADTLKYTPADRPLLLSWARSDAAGFRHRHPVVRVRERMLLRGLVEMEPKTGPQTVQVPIQHEIIRRLQADEGLSFADAQIEASKIIRATTRRAASNDADEIG